MTTIRFQQYDDTPTRTLQAQALGADARGGWYAIDEGALYLPWNADWCVLFHDVDGAACAEVVTIIPLHLSARLVEAVELDLGIRVTDSGIELTGRDELEWNTVAMDHPDRVVDRQQAACNEALSQLMEGEHPFDRPADVVLAELRRP